MIMIDWEKIESKLDDRIQIWMFSLVEHAIPKLLAQHQDKCPHGRKLKRFQWTLAGVGIGIGITAPLYGKALLSLVTG